MTTEPCENRVVIPVAVTARNEERAIGECLRSLLTAVEFAEARLPVRFGLLVAADECSDRTAGIAAGFAGVRVIECTGGKVEAQRAALGPGPFQVFSDADIRIEPDTLYAVCKLMFDEPSVQVAYPPKSPLPPQSRRLVAQALYLYNRENGYMTARPWFSGKFFAIRNWRVPTVAELAPRLAEMGALADDRFYGFRRGMRVDDIWLSRSIIREYGPGAIRETAGGRVWFRPPETLTGMYRYWKRMRREIERLDLLFPETRPTHARYGSRGTDRARLAAAPPRDRMLWRLFHVALAGCKLAYTCERFWYRRLARTDCEAWEPIPETKV